VSDKDVGDSLSAAAPLSKRKRRRRKGEGREPAGGIEAVRAAIDAPVEAPAPVATDTERPIDLLLNKEGHIRACLANAMAVLSGAPISNMVHLYLDNPWRDVLAFDEFACRTVLKEPPPWSMDPCWKGPVPWQPVDDLYCAEWLQHQGVMVDHRVAARAVEAVAARNAFHPVRDYLCALKWDQRRRLDHWLMDHLEVPDSDYARAVGAKWMISAVARIFEPGCKVDCCLILEGPQGKLKSTALRTLGAPWFADELAEIGSKDASLQTGGVWIIELAELDSMTRAEVSKVKAFMSRAVDRFRPPYGERTIERARQCVFAGTINPSGGYLRDETGARRFWPVEVREINIEGLGWVTHQLWAEAVTRYREGEVWWLNKPELIEAAAAAAEDRYEGDAWGELIGTHVAGRTSITVSEILRDVLKIEQGRWDRASQMRISRCLVALGMRRRQVRIDGQRQWIYERRE